MFHRKQPPRRESAWWEYYRLCGLTDEELQEDEDALGGLVYEGEVATSSAQSSTVTAFLPKSKQLRDVVEAKLANQT